MTEESVFLQDEQATEQFGRLLAFATGDPAMTPGAGEAIVESTAGGRIYLAGDLGAGKTTLVRGLMRAYGYEGAVKSPTYTLVEPYEFSRYNIYHFDLYRLSDPDEVEYLGVSDYFDRHNLCLVEWPDKGGSLLPRADLSIELKVEGRGRRLTWRAESPKGRAIADRLRKFSRAV